MALAEALSSQGIPKDGVYACRYKNNGANVNHTTYCLEEDKKKTRLTPTLSLELKLSPSSSSLLLITSFPCSMTSLVFP